MIFYGSSESHFVIRKMRLIKRLKIFWKAAKLILLSIL